MKNISIKKAWEFYSKPSIYPAIVGLMIFSLVLSDLQSTSTMKSLNGNQELILKKLSQLDSLIKLNTPTLPDSTNITP